MTPAKSKLQYFLAGATVVLCYFALCHRIDLNVIQLWDEARNVSNSIEMLRNHQWFTRYFEGKPDTWELKPPLFIWVQALSLKVFGFNEMASRLPSMLSSMATIGLLMLWSYKLTQTLMPGAIASLILVSTNAYIGPHAARFGDHDAMLCFFTTLFLFSFFRYLERKKMSDLILCFSALFLGWATKSITIFMFIPSIGLWLLFTRSTASVLRDKKFILAAFITLAGILSFYMLKEQIQPGYFHLVWQNEWFGRYFGLSRDFLIHKDPFSYYVEGMLNGRFMPYVFLFLFSALFVLFKKSFPNRNFIVFLLLQWFAFLLIISAGSKNFWYDLPLYPLACFIIALVFYPILTHLKNAVLKIAAITAFALFLMFNYAEAFSKTNNPLNDGKGDLDKLCNFLRSESAVQFGNFKVVNMSFNAPLYLYIEKAKQRHISIEIERQNRFYIGDIAVIADASQVSKLNSAYQSELLSNTYGCEVRKIIGYLH